MKKLYELYADEVFAHTDKEKYFLSIYTVSEFIEQAIDEEEKEYRISVLKELKDNLKGSDLVLSPYSQDISVYNEGEYGKAFTDFLDGVDGYRLLYEVLDSLGYQYVVEKCKDEKDSLELIEQLFN